MSELTVAPGRITERYYALLKASKELAVHRSIEELIRALATCLHDVVPFDFLALVLHEPGPDVMRLLVVEPASMELPPFSSMPVAAGGPGAQVWLSQEPVVIPIPQEGRLLPTLEFLRRNGQLVSCWLPLTTVHGRFGVLAFGSSKSDDYTPDSVDFMLQVAAHVAVAVDNAINFERSSQLQEELSKEQVRLQCLLHVTQALISQIEYPEILRPLSESLQPVIPHDGLGLAIFDRDAGELRLRLSYDSIHGLRQFDVLLPPDSSPPGIALPRRSATMFTREELNQLGPADCPTLTERTVQSICCVPLRTNRGPIGSLHTFSTTPHRFAHDAAELFMRASGPIGLALDAGLAYRDLRDEHSRLIDEKRYLEHEIISDHEFGDIVGRSAAMKAVLREARTVARTDATVLLRGETGTGKELIARAIHQLSPRRDRTFVRFSAAAVPSGLLESELFGYEKGAFTGATASRIGRIELAHRGTLFLDEVGDLALELQPKLLRVLQEREFERLGSSHTRQVDVRIVAATNRNLEAMVADGSFREDLYYRLSVFPIVLPPLRDRPEDVPPLVRYFASRVAKRLGRPVPQIAAPVMNALKQWHWPGNIRELENVVERAVILAEDGVLRVSMDELRPRLQSSSTSKATTLADSKREAILQALRESRGVIAGPHGAAARLGLKRTTLQSLMRRLDIEKPGY